MIKIYCLLDHKPASALGSALGSALTTVPGVSSMGVAALAAPAAAGGGNAPPLGALAGARPWLNLHAEPRWQRPFLCRWC